MKIGILGGTFDPIHWGHIGLAEEAKKQGELDRVLLMPAHISPFKIDNLVTDDALRYRMVELAIVGMKGFEACDKEISNNREISYTIDTLRECKEEFKSPCTLFFILGTDAILNIEKWYKAEELLREFSFIVGSRPGYREEELKALILRLKIRYGCEVIKIDNKLLDISSTDIKQYVRAGKDISSAVPKKVEEFIVDKRLYL